jgi:alanine dehydrogenase
MSIQTGARFLQKLCGGKGILLGDVPGVEFAKGEVDGYFG